MLLSVFAAAALLMAGVGLYGLLAYGVAQQRREIGIRIALGAERSHVVGMILMQGVKLVSIGVVVGLAVSFFATTLLATLLYQTATRDFWTFAAAPLVLLAAALTACTIPAVRAARVEPVQALRLE